MFLSADVGASWVDDALANAWSMNAILESFLFHNRDNLDALEHALEASVRTRVQNQPRVCKRCCVLRNKIHDIKCDDGHSRVGLLFSGGLDSAVLAALVDRVLPPEQSIDLVNVAFQTTSNGQFDDVPDRLTAIQV